ncbi:L,D-transpeptidase family protein [Hymenobacter sp. DH14]|uniref:L,D-transpeptidase family protein n=1 Tax=Hymenobacter cyanobacteriorum TaxID=2926463 RepID=A0A9X1VHZ3_9BACT|nr:L,D-transpeptidase family protein [Hymenobacter cyanobacteriorum]MCI1188627.1 L,D-transpeptidase family protein [Hymenobacter cyanobacteriorum]
MLDTAVGHARAADARLGLRAGSAVRAFYAPGCAPAWTTPADSLNADAYAALRLLARAAEYGLPADYASAALLALRDSLRRPAAPDPRARQLARLEIGLSDAVLRFMHDLHRGRLHPDVEPSRASGVGEQWQPAAGLRSALSQNQLGKAVLSGQPANREYRQLQQALARWLARPGSLDSAAVRRAQYETAALNLERWRSQAWAPVAEYIFINLPAFELQVVAFDSVRQRHRVIIGKPVTPTPTLISSAIHYFTLAPDWHVPHSIATKEMLPQLKRDPGYLSVNNLELYDDRGRWRNPYSVRWAAVSVQNFPYRIRQAPGCENALGNVVFRFPNPYSVYLHDTPARQLFAQPVRAFSHGCVRLAEPLALAAYLLRREGRPVRLPSEAECARQPQPRDVRLGRPLPLFVRYATCVGEGGRLRFFADVYGRDEALRQALFGAVARR